MTSTEEHVFEYGHRGVSCVVGADAPRRLSLEGQEKAVGYLEAVLEEIAFEKNAPEAKAYSRL